MKALLFCMLAGFAPFLWASATEPTPREVEEWIAGVFDWAAYYGEENPLSRVASPQQGSFADFLICQVVSNEESASSSKHNTKLPEQLSTDGSFGNHGRVSERNPITIDYYEQLYPQSLRTHRPTVIAPTLADAFGMRPEANTTFKMIKVGNTFFGCWDVNLPCQPRDPGF